MPDLMKPLTRGEGRVAATGTREFRPNYLSFAGTFQCNLNCAHCCVPIEWTDRLQIPAALRFLEQAHAAGIRILGFTGGEPFLYPEFLFALTERAAQLGFRFDKLMTNGVWFESEEQLVEILSRLKGLGFSGKLGLSVDKFHGNAVAKLALFCRVARRIFDRDNILSLSYASRSPEKGQEPIVKLATELGGVIAWSELLQRYLLVSDELTMTMNWNHLATVERAESLPGNPWDGTWFEEDYCEGPGQALIVNPKGEVKPCCGFASDLDQLTIGNIYQHSVSEVIQAGREHPFVGKLFREGLSRFREEIQATNPAALPGATSNHCYFCWYVLTKNLVKVPERGTSRRVSLPLTGQLASEPVAAKVSESETSLLMSFDGQIVTLSQELLPEMPLEKGRVYLIKITGPSTIALPPRQLGWTAYQSWIDGLRKSGYTLTTHSINACHK